MSKRMWVTIAIISPIALLSGWTWAWYMSNKLKADDYANQYDRKCMIKRDRGEACM